MKTSCSLRSLVRWALILTLLVPHLASAHQAESPALCPLRPFRGRSNCSCLSCRACHR